MVYLLRPHLTSRTGKQLPACSRPVPVFEAPGGQGGVDELSDGRFLVWVDCVQDPLVHGIAAALWVAMVRRQWAGGSCSQMPHRAS